MHVGVKVVDMEKKRLTSGMVAGCGINKRGILHKPTPYERKVDLIDLLDSSDEEEVKLLVNRREKYSRGKLEDLDASSTAELAHSKSTARKAQMNRKNKSSRQNFEQSNSPSDLVRRGASQDMTTALNYDVGHAVKESIRECVDLSFDDDSSKISSNAENCVNSITTSDLKYTAISHKENRSTGSESIIRNFTENIDSCHMRKRHRVLRLHKENASGSYPRLTPDRRCGNGLNSNEKLTDCVDGNVVRMNSGDSLPLSQRDGLSGKVFLIKGKLCNLSDNFGGSSDDECSFASGRTPLGLNVSATKGIDIPKTINIVDCTADDDSAVVSTSPLSCMAKPQPCKETESRTREEGKTKKRSFKDLTSFDKHINFSDFFTANKCRLLSQDGIYLPSQLLTKDEAALPPEVVRLSHSFQKICRADMKTLLEFKKRRQSNSMDRNLEDMVPRRYSKVKTIKQRSHVSPKPLVVKSFLDCLEIHSRRFLSSEGMSNARCVLAAHSGELAEKYNNWRERCNLGRITFAFSFVKRWKKEAEWHLKTIESLLCYNSDTMEEDTALIVANPDRLNVPELSDLPFEGPSHVSLARQNNITVGRELKFTDEAQSMSESEMRKTEEIMNEVQHLSHIMEGSDGFPVRAFTVLNAYDGARKISSVCDGLFCSSFTPFGQWE